MIHALLLACLLMQTQTAEPGTPPDVTTLIRSGQDAENRRDLDQAIAAYRKAAELAPSFSDVFLKLGNALMRKGDYTSAIPVLKRAAELSPDSAPVHKALGFALLTRGYASEAIPHLEFVHEYGALGIAQLQAGRAAEAVGNLQAAIAVSPEDDPDLLYYLGRATAEVSSNSLDKLLVTFPNSARVRQAQAQIYRQLQMFPEAIGEYKKAIAMRPELPGLRLELGQIYASNSDWVKAEQEFRVEAELQPGNAEVAYLLGKSLLNQGKKDGAVEELRRSNKLRPDNSETLYSLGEAAAAINPAEAEQNLNRVIALEKETPLAGSAYFVLAGIHRKQGKTELASKEMQEALRLRPVTKAPAK
jgi:tetratricopeptide (TPR) repeat protein